MAIKNPASPRRGWPYLVFICEKIINNYAVMKKSLKISFSLFKVFWTNKGT